MRRGPTANVRQLPTIALTRKNDSARLIAFDVVSPLMRRRSRIPVASRDCTSRSGNDVVLLKDIAGVTQDGRPKSFTLATPRAREVTL